MEHVVNKYNYMLKENVQRIKELKAILRTPRLYDQYKKQLEKALNEEVARQTVLFGDVGVDSLMHTLQTVGGLDSSRISNGDSIVCNNVDAYKRFKPQTSNFYKSRYA